MAQPQAAAHACRNRNYVFQGSTQFNSGEIVVHINAETWIAEIFLHARRQRAIGRGDRNGSRMFFRYFLGERWPAESAHLWLKPAEPHHNLMDYLSHAQQGVIFNSLGGAHKQHMRLKPLRHMFKCSPAM